LILKWKREEGGTDATRFRRKTFGRYTILAVSLNRSSPFKGARQERKSGERKGQGSRITTSPQRSSKNHTVGGDSRLIGGLPPLKKTAEKEKRPGLDGQTKPLDGERLANLELREALRRHKNDLLRANARCSLLSDDIVAIQKR